MPSTKSETTPAHNLQFDALGTPWEVTSKRPITKEMGARIRNELTVFERTYSRFIDRSLVSTASQKPGVYTFPASAEEIFSFYEQLFELTQGKVTPLVGDTLASAGYDRNYSLKPAASIHAVLPYDQVVRRMGNVITTTRATLLDIGAVGKGYVVDMITNLLQEDGHDTFTVDASGDMRVVGDSVELVGLENPYNFEEVVGAIELKDKALCASASNRRAWGEWHHIINPDDTSPTREIIATWVVADSAMIADGLATALFFVSPETLSAKYNYEYMRMHADGSVEYSDYFAGGVFE